MVIWLQLTSAIRLSLTRSFCFPSGREQKDNDVIAYHLRQSFKPGEITLEPANKIGYDLARSPNSKRFVRCSSLGEDYSEETIVERISGKRIVAPQGKGSGKLQAQSAH